MQEQQKQPFLFVDGKKRSDEKYESWDRMNHAWRAQNYRASEPLRSPTRSPITTAQSPNHYRSLSPASRTQAIARGQRELMEMVKNMPEACYELSLKDLVEHKHRQRHGDEEEEDVEERNDVSSETDLLESETQSSWPRVEKRQAVVGARVDGVRRRVGEGNDGSGRSHMLKVVLPLPFGTAKKKKQRKTKMTKTPLVKKSDCSEGVNGKNDNGESPRPSVEKEWWRKRYSPANTAAADGESDRLSSSTGSKSSSTSGSRSSSITSRSNSNNAR